MPMRSTSVRCSAPGYENVSKIAEEFRDPKRDFKRSIILSVLLIGAPYIAVATVTIGTGAFKAGGGVAPFAAIIANTLGRYGAVGTAALALISVLPGLASLGFVWIAGRKGKAWFHGALHFRGVCDTLKDHDASPSAETDTPPQ